MDSKINKTEDGKQKKINNITSDMILLSVEHLIQQLKLKPLKKQSILETLDCHLDNPLYSELSIEYDALEEDIYNYIEPAAAASIAPMFQRIELADYKNRNGIYCIVTIGQMISDYTSAFFAAGDYLKGLLADVMADAILFQLDVIFTEYMKKECCHLGLGVEKRLEAPSDYPMLIQEKIKRLTACKQLSHIYTTSGFMYHPLKTMGYILLLTDDINTYLASHNCSRCQMPDCRWRKLI